jgi:hypothetical protein
MPEAPVSGLKDFLTGIRELSCADLVAKLALQIAALGPDVDTEIGPFTVRFRVRGRTLCELSVYGELFIVRSGPASAVEYRVRHEEVAWRALEEVLREYLFEREAAVS